MLCIKAVIKKCREADKRRSEDVYCVYDKKGDKIYAEDGAETTALISIMLGAIKELNTKFETLESKVEKCIIQKK